MSSFPGTDDFPGEIMYTTKKYKDENPEIVQKFVNAVVQGSNWIKENNDTEVAKALKSLFAGLALSFVISLLFSYLLITTFQQSWGYFCQHLTLFI